MSLANLIVQRNCAYLVTDSGYFRDDGTVLSLGPKSMEVPELTLALATVGSLHLGYLARVLEDLPPIGSQREFLSKIGDIMRAAYELAGFDPVERWSRLMIAFYSRQHARAGGYTMWTAPAAGPEGLEPWRLHGVGSALLPHVDQRAVLGRDVDLTDSSAFDPRCDMMPIIEEQRRPSSNWQNVDWGCFVAGDICLTTVSVIGVETTMLHSYSDVVGQKAAAG